MVDLLKHNEEAYEKIKSVLADGKNKIAIAHATGTGKSYLIAKLFKDFNSDKKLVLVPSTYISNQIQKLFDKYEIKNADIMLYQRLIKMSDEDIAAKDYDVIALDEYHHNTSKVWGNKVRILIESHSESIIFGTSATPVRSDGVNTIDELFEGNCASDLPLSESIARKIVPLPKYVGALYTLDDELEKLRQKVENATNTKEEKQEFYKKIDLMRSQIEKSYGMPIILNKHIKDKEGKFIVFCKKKKHLKDIKGTVIDWFKTAGCKNINAYEVYSDYENRNAEFKAFCADTSHALKLLFCVDMLNEGLHLENISGVLLLRPTRSSIVWYQQIGRAIEANNTNTPVIIDAVNNFSSVGQGMELLREIKDVVEREKESDPNFDDSEFVDIDTFFVLEQILEIQKIFREIEGRFENNWDLYIRALKQYKEREGDCLVPKRHIEILEENIKINLGQWILNIRGSNKGTTKYLLTTSRVQQLNEVGFVWDELKNRFQVNVNSCLKFYEENGRLPNKRSCNDEERKLGEFLGKNSNRLKMPQWKIDLLEKVPLFFEKKENRIDRFCRYIRLYRKKYGHIDIKRLDRIDGYNIGSIYGALLKDYKNGKLTDMEIVRLKNIGIDISIGKMEKEFSEKIVLAQQAINENVIITSQNQTYHGVNLYAWYLNHKNKFTNDQLKIMNTLIPKVRMKPINVVDIKSGNIYTYSSISEAGKALKSEFYVVKSDNIGRRAIYDRLTGHTKNPIYKERFRFEYVK